MAGITRSKVSLLFERRNSACAARTPAIEARRWNQVYMRKPKKNEYFV